jgi:NAD(P) transhydrogenase subunit alpha
MPEKPNPDHLPSPRGACRLIEQLRGPRWLAAIRLVLAVLLLMGAWRSSAGQSNALVDADQADGAEVIAEAAFAPPAVRQQQLIASLTIFVLAIFVGFEVITKVPPTLHTPLMSGSNAISGITLVGAAIAAGGSTSALGVVVGVVAVAFATVNVAGGFLTTHRMLAMFQRR